MSSVLTNRQTLWTSSEAEPAAATGTTEAAPAEEKAPEGASEEAKAAE